MELLFSTLLAIILYIVFILPFVMLCVGIVKKVMD